MATLHIRCGSDIAGALEEAGIEGDFLEFCDPVCQGPAPSGLDAAAYRLRRAEFISKEWNYASVSECRARLEREDAALDELTAYDRVFLWFEHDLYDQSVLIDLLSRLKDRTTIKDRLFLLSINSHPKIERFIGFGQLSPEQLAGLIGSEVPLTDAMIDSAAMAWTAFRAATPEALAAFIRQDHCPLPDLIPALRRHLQELPWTTDGMSLTERLSLKAIADGAKTPAEAFRRLHRGLEPMPFLGDLMYWAVLRRLTLGTRPALTPFETHGDTISLSAFGSALLAGDRDWIVDNGIERWVGGVHLTGAHAAWRWDPESNRPVSGANA